MERLKGENTRRWPLIVAIICCVFCLVIGIIIGLASRRASGNDEMIQKLKRFAVDGIAEKLQDELQPKNILETLRFMSSEPHLAGSEREHELADWVKTKWEEFGADHVTKTPYNVLLSYPNKNNPNKVSIVDPSGAKIFETSGFEKKLSPDQNHSEVVPPFNAFIRSGTVTGDLVYANYGRAKDFELLATLGVNCSGKIVIARYGKIYRGNKVVEAEKHGALGIILYSDPEEVARDGVNVFPKSWWLPGTGIQRGSASLTKGDALTQGYPAKDYAYRMPMKEYKQKIQLQIPCQPIGYDDAKEFLMRLGGPKAPDDWQGGLNLQYNLGPGFVGNDSANEVKLEVHNKEEMKLVYNVVGRINGSIEPDRYVIIGGHRDSWMFGSIDALSSQSCLIEIVRAFCALKNQGWRPRRTLVFISWGAEEYGMVGSYEWVEEHWKTLQDRAVAYLNGDGALKGNYTLKAHASPIVRDVVFEAAKKVRDPNDKKNSLYDTWRERYPSEENDGLPKVHLPGSGTDYAHFLYFAGIPVTYHMFIPDPSRAIVGYPLYHTVYETFQLINIMDPEAKYMMTVAQVWAEMARSLLDAYVLPLSVKDSAENIHEYVKKAKEIYGEKMSTQGIRFDALDSASENLTRASIAFQNDLDSIDLNNPLEVRRVNDKMMKLERMFLDMTGQPGRPTMRHVVYSPSSKDNYSGAVFSGLADLLYDIDKLADPRLQWIAIKKHFAIIIHTIQSAADFLSQP